MKIKKNDKVQVITGKDKGRTGKVLKVIAEEGRLAIEKVNIVKKHIKAKGKEPGGIVEIEKPIDISNVMLVCPKCKKLTRVGYKLEDDKKIRICKKCTKEID